MPPAPELSRVQKRSLEYVKQACDARVVAHQRLSDADHEFRRRIAAAAAIGCSLDQIAQAAGISKTRVHQIIQSDK